MALVRDAKNRIKNNYIKSIYDKITFRLGNSMILLEIQMNVLIIYILISCLALIKALCPQKKNNFSKK